MIGAELHFMLIRSLRSSVVIPSALIIFFKMLNLFFFYLSAQYKEQVHCIITGNK